MLLAENCFKNYKDLMAFDPLVGPCMTSSYGKKERTIGGRGVVFACGREGDADNSGWSQGETEDTMPPH